MSALYELVYSRQWQVPITHIQSLADGDAADLLFFLINVLMKFFFKYLIKQTLVIDFF